MTSLHNRWLALVTVAVAAPLPARAAGAQVVPERVVVVHACLALGRGFLQRTGRDLPEYGRGVQNALQSMNGQSFSASLGVNVGSRLGLIGEYTVWSDGAETLRSFLAGPVLRYGGRTALLARVAVGRVEAPITEEWIVSSGGEADVNFATSMTSGLGGQVSSGVERVLWPGAAVQLLFQWTMATLPDRVNRPIRYDYGSIRAGGVIYLEPRRFPRAALPNQRMQLAGVRK